MNTTGKNLKEILHDKRLSQAQFAEICGTTRQNIANYINDLSKPNYDVLYKLYKNLNINLNWFITGEGNMYNQLPNEALKDELRKEFEELLRKRGL